MISGLPLTTTADSLFDYLKGRFESKGISREEIKLAYDLTKLQPVLDELKFLREVKQTLATSGPEVIQNRLMDFFYSDGLTEAVESGRVLHPSSLITSKYDNVDAMKFYSEREAILLARKDEMLSNRKFTGTAFVRFNSPVDAKATKKELRKLQQSARFWNDVVENQEFRPSKWSVEYAPPGSQINWSQLKDPRQLWKTLVVLLILAATYFLYIVLLAAPGYIVELLHLVGHGSDHFSVSWNVFILPTLASFFTSKLTELVTNIDMYRHHQFVSSIELGRFRSICNLSAILYLIRMMATKPLAELFIGRFTYGDISWACLFFPEHGSFITCAIIVNTASGILMNHVRLEFLTSYLLKWFTFRSNAEQITWRRNYRLEFDFAANYAELTSNFGLTMLIFIMFPVIGVVSWVCGICRFLSDRAALMEMYAISNTSPELHREPIDQVICLSIFSPLALLGYRIIQMGSKSVAHLVEESFLAPLCVAILYALYLIVAHWRFHWPKMIRLRQWFGYPINEEEEEEEDVVDWSTYLQHEYDPITKIQSEQFSYKSMV
jgi:RNA recognition motif-containing protein